jgi:hypothetical protein
MYSFLAAQPTITLLLMVSLLSTVSLCTVTQSTQSTDTLFETVEYAPLYGI